MGNRAGDEVLCSIATRLSALLRDSDTVIRVAGDEFVIVVPELTCKDDLQILERKILAHIREPVLVAGTPLKITCSIGLALYPDDANNADALISYADNAMYAAKRNGKDRGSPDGTKTPSSL